MNLIFHATAGDDWAEAVEAGEYRLSARGRTLEDEGFIHASTAAQLEGTANKFYIGEHGLVLLAIDVARVGPEIRYEGPSGSQELFPHIYGPLNVDAVVVAIPFEPGADGRFTLPEAARQLLDG